VAAIEPQVRAYCARALDPLAGRGGFDFVTDLGAEMPMRVIGMLLGIPEGDQEQVRDYALDSLRTEAGEPLDTSTNDIGSHVTFGYGIHYCLGAALARLEGRVALEEVRRFPDWEVDRSGAALAITSAVRGWDTLPVVVP